MNIIIGLLTALIVLTNLLVIAVCMFSGMLEERDTTAARPQGQALIHMSQLPVGRTAASSVSPTTHLPAASDLLAHRTLEPAG